MIPLHPFSYSAFFQEAVHAQIIDMRPVEQFKQTFIPGSLYCPVDDISTEIITAMIGQRDIPLLFVDNGASMEKAAATFQELGYSVMGYLEAGFATWQSNNDSFDMIIDVEVDELIMDIPFDENMVIMDVRSPIEYAEGHLSEAVNFSLTDITDPLRIAGIQDNDNLYLYSGSGVRSTVAAAFLKKHGIHNLRNVAGGWTAIRSAPKATISKNPEILN